MRCSIHGGLSSGYRGRRVHRMAEDFGTNSVCTKTVPEGGMGLVHPGRRKRDLRVAGQLDDALLG